MAAVPRPPAGPVPEGALSPVNAGRGTPAPPTGVAAGGPPPRAGSPASASSNDSNGSPNNAGSAPVAAAGGPPVAIARAPGPPAAMAPQEKPAAAPEAAGSEAGQASQTPQASQQSAPAAPRQAPPQVARDTAEDLLKLPQFDQLPSHIDRMDAFIRSEHKYVERALRVVVEGFEERLRHHIDLGDQILTPEEISAVFLDISHLYKFHQRMLDDLQETRLKGADVLYNTLGKKMSTYIPFFKMYVNYIQTIKQAKKVLLGLIEKKSHFRKWLELNCRCAGHSLVTFLDCPTARLPQYLVFLGSIYEACDVSTPAAQELLAAIVAIQQVADNISTTLRNIRYRNLVLRVQERMFKGSLDVVSPHRWVCKLGDLTVVQPKSMFGRRFKTYAFVLFNDFLLYGSRPTQLSNGKPKAAIRLDGMLLEVRKTDVEYKYGFSLSSLIDGTEVHLAAQGQKEMQEWLRALHEAIELNDLNNQTLQGGRILSAKDFEAQIFRRRTAGAKPETIPRPRPTAEQNAQALEGYVPLSSSSLKRTKAASGSGSASASGSGDAANGGWERLTDSHGQVYYENRALGLTQWDMPAEFQSQSPASSGGPSIEPEGWVDIHATTTSGQSPVRPRSGSVSVTRVPPPTVPGATGNAPARPNRPSRPPRRGSNAISQTLPAPGGSGEEPDLMQGLMSASGAGSASLPPVRRPPPPSLPPPGMDGSPAASRDADQDSDDDNQDDSQDASSQAKPLLPGRPALPALPGASQDAGVVVASVPALLPPPSQGGAMLPPPQGGVLPPPSKAAGGDGGMLPPPPAYTPDPSASPKHDNADDSAGAAPSGAGMALGGAGASSGGGGIALGGGGAGRGDLLSAIRGGAQLKKRDASVDLSNDGGSSPSTSASSGGPGGFLADIRGGAKLRKATEVNRAPPPAPKEGLAGQVSTLQDALKSSLNRYRKFVQNDDEEDDDEDWD